MYRQIDCWEDIKESNSLGFFYSNFPIMHSNAFLLHNILKISMFDKSILMIIRVYILYQKAFMFLITLSYILIEFMAVHYRPWNLRSDTAACCLMLFVWKEILNHNEAFTGLINVIQ